jgi:hypothetical protein
MKKVYLILILVTLLFQSCHDDDNDCGECFSPPEDFAFEIVDKTSGENLFTNGTYNAEDITITNSLNDDEPVTFTFISENEYNIINISSIGWQTEIVDLTIAVSDTPIFNFYVDAERKTANCCSHTEYNEITISGSEFEAETGIYIILVE